MGISATALSAPASVDDVTLVKTAGIISVKTGNGANQAVILDGSGKMPAVDGSALTNIISHFNKIATVTLGSAAASIDFSGLTKTSYMLVFNFKSTASLGISLTVNGDNTATNYYSQYLIATSTTLGSARLNSARICDINAGLGSTATIFITKNVNGYFTTNFTSNQGTSGSDLTIYAGATQKTGTIASITQLTLITSTSTLTTGSTATLYELVV